MVRGLRKYLTPFAPDQSGAVSILYELGGMVVILDAGGCTGNICGFDEPRWSSDRSAIFSAGLRDMDAIMGRDKALVEKIAAAQERLQSKFIAIVGTPVPAVIGTDYQALRRMLQKKVSVPILCIETNGMKSFEYGAEKAYLALLAAFSLPREAEDNAGDAGKPTEAGRIGVFGTFPITESGPAERTWIEKGIAESLKEGVLLPVAEDASAASVAEDTSVVSGADSVEKRHPLCFYGHGASLADYRSASENVLNVVTSVPGLAAAKELKKRFGTEYRVQHPSARRLLQNAWEKLSEDERKKLLKEEKCMPAAAEISSPVGRTKLQRILIVQEQVLGNSLRKAICELYAVGGQSTKPEIHVMSFFKMLPEWMEEGDRFLSEESELWAILNPGQNRAERAGALSQEKSVEAATEAEDQKFAAYDLILGDPVLKKMLPSDFSGCFLEIPEPAISGFPVNTTNGGQDE